MTPITTELLDSLRLSLKRPKDGMRRVLLLGLNRQTLWLALGVSVIVATLLNYVHEMVTPVVTDLQGNPLVLPSPFVLVFFTLVVRILIDFVIARLGNAFGGTGNFFDILLADIWLRVFEIILMVAGIVAYLISPGIGQMVLYATYFYLFWLMLNFVAEAHGGMSLGKTLGLVLLSALIAAIPIIVVLNLMGVSPVIGT